jgi:hypothetical protein
MNLIGRLKTICDVFCEKTGLTWEQVSYQIFNDRPRLTNAFTGDSGLTVASLEKAVAWFNENWPDAVEWPADTFARPEPAQQIEAAE